MIYKTVYGINPHASHWDFITFIKTIFGEYSSLTVIDTDFWMGLTRSDETGFILFTGPGQKHLKDILPHYLNGDLKHLLPTGYLFFLHSKLLDFKAEQGDLKLETWLNWHQRNDRHLDSPYIYTMCVKEFHDCFLQTLPDAPYVITLGYDGSKPDHEELTAKVQQVREGLNLDESVHILACDIHDKGDCKHVLMTLMTVIGDFPGREKVMPLIEAL
jgi:hypothetical protein